MTVGLTTPQGHFLHAVLLGDRSLARRLQSRAKQDATAYAAVLEGAFVVVIGRLRQTRFGPTEIRLFSQQVMGRIRADAGVTVDDVSRIIHLELGNVVSGDDVVPAHSVAGQQAVVAAATTELRLTPGEIDRVISEAESLARQWGFELVPYRPSLLMRWRFELAEGRWYGSADRKRWAAERMGAFVTWLGALRS
ncbi:hypothetical protein [Verrucosispora sp. WMMC514]|uniref:hypothetical protein n=1 Tax=Verrucosispora sp. WMMC514 TaxID=3015156 RepID=UPI00248C87FD|nr:hypothetical protein [Verrucosispora sp. WMMC514]WBB93405.1 hypothetical protein O7597_10715 [Verrucosispora sp. WMMC514]